MSDEDAHKVQVPRHEMLMERKIKATGERVGGEDWVRATRSTGNLEPPAGDVAVCRDHGRLRGH